MKEKLITGIGSLLSGKLLLYNGLDNSIYKISVPAIQENKKIDRLGQYDDSIDCHIEMTVDAKSLLDIISNEASLQLVDVRSIEEYESYHLPNSICIPLQDLETRRQELDKSLPLYLVCQSGVRSLQALIQLKDQGFKAGLFHVNGGINSLKILSPI